MSDRPTLAPNRLARAAVVVLGLVLLGAPGCSGSSATGGATDTITGSDLAFALPDAFPDGAGPSGDTGGDAGPAEDSAEWEATPTPVPDVEAFDYPCEPGEVQACVTVCGSAGTQLCFKEWGPCIPPEESCVGCVDDDCDGLINELCPDNPLCDPTPDPECPSAIMAITEGLEVGVGTTLHLSAAQSASAQGAIVQWAWSVETPAGGAGQFQPSAEVESPSYTVDVAGQYLFSLDVWDDTDLKSCSPAQAAVTVIPYPPVDPEVGCADGGREGFLDVDAYSQIAGCAGGWDQPGVTPDSVVPTCDRGGGDDGGNPDGTGCASADLCGEDWHICDSWREVAARSPNGCVGATPPDARPKSLFFAIRQFSENYSQCGEPGDGFNDVFGCGNLGHGLPPEKACGPLDRVLASTQPNSCGYNEAEPNLGPWECFGPDDSHLNEGALVTKKGCPNQSCSYDGYPVSSWDKGGVLCCRD